MNRRQRGQSEFVIYEVVLSDEARAAVAASRDGELAAMRDDARFALLAANPALVIDLLEPDKIASLKSRLAVAPTEVAAKRQVRELNAALKARLECDGNPIAPSLLAPDDAELVVDLCRAEHAAVTIDELQECVASLIEALQTVPARKRSQNGSYRGGGLPVHRPRVRAVAPAAAAPAARKRAAPIVQPPPLVVRLHSSKVRRLLDWPKR